MVFARTFDDNLASLVKQIDKLVDGKDPRSEIGAYVNFLGPERKELVVQARAFGGRHQLKNVSLAIPHEAQDGPRWMKIHPEAQVTVVIYQFTPEKVVKANHVVWEKSLGRRKIKKVIADVKKHL